MKNLLVSLLAWIAAGLLSACSNHLLYQGTCLTCLDDPFSGKPLNYDSSLASNKPVSHYGDVVLSSRLNVDTAALRIKRAFGYESTAEVQARLGSRTAEWLTDGQDFAWSAEPGSLYTMKQSVQEGSLTAVVARQGSGSTVTFSFAADRQHFGTDAQTYLAEVRRRAEQALR